MYTTVIVRPYLETTVATKNEGMQVVESIKKEIVESSLRSIGKWKRTKA